MNIKFWHLIFINYFLTSVVYVIEGFSFNFFDGVILLFGEFFSFDYKNISAGLRLRLLVYIFESAITFLLIPLIMIFGIFEYKNFNWKISRLKRYFGAIFFLIISWLGFPFLFFWEIQ